MIQQAISKPCVINLISKERHSPGTLCILVSMSNSDAEYTPVEVYVGVAVVATVFLIVLIVILYKR